MSVVLAATWNPRGEAKRFRRLYAELSRVFAHMVVILPPHTHFGLMLSLRHYEKLSLHMTDNWPGARHESLSRAVDYMPKTSASHIMYADMDRLLRWSETRHEELRQTAKRVQMYDALIIGRSKWAYDTHPQALIQTEALANRMFSHILNMEVDLSAGAKGFSRKAAQFIVANANNTRPFGADSEWVVLAKRGGFELRTVTVDGLDWESADRHADEAADAEQQELAAKEYDSHSANWEKRVAVADEIVEAGILALKQELVRKENALP